MKGIDQLIEEKRAQLAKVQAQLEVLEELAGEASETSPAKSRSAQPKRRGRARVGRGANQQRVLAALSDSPQRARDIAAAARLTPAAVNQVLMVLSKRGSVTRAGRGLYKLAGKASARTQTIADGGRTRRSRRGRKKGNRRPRKAAASKARGSKEPSAGRQEAAGSGAAQE